jgi:hypothetical protein
MMQNKYLVFILFLIFAQSCIKEFEPDFKDSIIEKYVVEGTLKNEEGWQTVTVSKTSSLSDEEFVPILNCEVAIIDELGNEKVMTDLSDGTYGTYVESDFLVIGRGYKVKVVTPENEILESEFDELSATPELIPPTYQIENQAISEISTTIDGLQFYIDLNAEENESQYYRWVLTETWEYHAKYPVEYYYDGSFHQLVPPDSSEFYCWKTQKVDEIFVLSTENLSSNSFSNFPLHFVGNNTPKLGVLYSLKIDQISISKAAYEYWKQLGDNQSTGGGLYTSQPIAVKGNMKNRSNPDEDVLGFFQASSISSFRIFVDTPNGLDMNFSDLCYPIPFERSFSEINPILYPVYLETVNDQRSNNIMNDECLFCTLRGGSTTKPDFWP